MIPNVYDIYTMILYATISMVIIASSFYSLYLLVKTIRKVHVTAEKVKIYACGEDLPVDKASVSGLNFYWGVVRKSLRSLYAIIRDKMHTGILSDWLFFMSFWLVIIVIALSLSARW